MLLVCVVKLLFTISRNALFCMPLAPPPATHHWVLLPSCQLPLPDSERQMSVVCACASRGKLVMSATSANKTNAKNRLPTERRHGGASASGNTLPVGVFDKGKWVFFGPEKMRCNRSKIKPQKQKLLENPTKFMRHYSLFSSGQPTNENNGAISCSTAVYCMLQRQTKIVNNYETCLSLHRKKFPLSVAERCFWIAP